MDRALLHEGISAATGLPEHHDEGYAAMTTIADEGRRHIPATNPFAKEVSSLSFRAIKQVHQGALGVLEQVTQQIETFAPQTAASAASSTSSPDLAAAWLGNQGSPSALATDGPAPVDQPPSSANPFSTTASETSYIDPASKTNYRIPTGHTLYRDTSGAELRVVRLADVRPKAGAVSGDRPAAGEQSCSADGVGVVTPECERKRAKGKNPFVPAAPR